MGGSRDVPAPTDVLLFVILPGLTDLSFTRILVSDRLDKMLLVFREMVESGRLEVPGGFLGLVT